MAGLSSWLSPNVMHALGWALIHSLWQCLALAAAAAVLMAVSSRPSVRYGLGVCALAAMLAVPVATLFVLVRAPARVVPVAGLPLVAAPSSQAPAAVSPSVALSPVQSSGAAPEASSVMHMLEANQLASQNILPWLVAGWLAGVAFFSARFAGGFLLLEHMRHRQSAVPNAGLLALCQEVQRQLGLDRAIQYLECGWLQTPAVIGWIRPAVLIPISALTGLSEAQLRAVIAHELAHIRRFDTFVNLFQVLVETLLFYHPAVWWMNKRIRAERELCCDEIAVAASGNRLEYARALTLMAELESAPRLAMAINRGPLAERIFHILGRKSASAGQRMFGITGSVLFLVAALAAANALFVVAAPPIAQAKESVKAVLSASQATVAHLAQQVFQASESAKPSDVRTDSTVAEAAQPSNDVQHQELTPLSADLSKLPAIDALTTPTVLASNAPPVARQSSEPVNPALPARPVAQNGQRTRTEAGLACLLGLAPWGCQDVIFDIRTSANARRETIACAGTDVPFGEVPGPACLHGPLEAVDYVGSNASGADVYRVQYMHADFTYVIMPPGPDGEIGKFWIRGGKPNGISSLVRVTAPTVPRAIYRRADLPVTATGTGAIWAARNEHAVVPSTPSGAGDPSLVVCRAPQPITGSSQSNPEVCLYNYEWLKVAMNGKDVATDGKTLIDRPTAESGARPNLKSNERPVVTASAAATATTSGPKTEAGIKCLTSLGPWMCWTMFDSQWASGATLYCRGSGWLPNTEGLTGLCRVLESIEYLGTNADGDDVYSVKLDNKTETYVLPQPGPDGKIATRCKFGGTPVSATVGACLGGRSAVASMAKVTSPASGLRMIYPRPAEGGGQAPTISSEAAANAVVMANTPIGAGDPDAVVCRAPQPIAGSGQLGSKVCLHNYDWWKVAMNGKDVAPDGKNLIDRPTVNNPTGEGDPDAITCRTRKVISRQTEWVKRYSPVVCRLNSFWADVIKSHQMVTLNGDVVAQRLGGGGGELYGNPVGSAGGGYPDSGSQPSGGPAPH